MYIGKIISLAESKRSTAFRWTICAGTIILLRNLLEAAFESHTLGFSPNLYHSFLRFFVHYPAIYITGALIIALILQILSREKMENVARTVFSFFWIICIPPLIDVVVSGGAGYHLGYFTNFRMAVRALVLFPFLWTDPAPNISPGIRIEMAVLCCLAGIYIGHKTGSILKTIAAVALVPISIFGVLGSLPLGFAVLTGKDYLAALTGRRLEIGPDAAVAMLNLAVLALALVPFYLRLANRPKPGFIQFGIPLGICLLGAAGIIVGGVLAKSGNAEIPMAPADFLAATSVCAGLFLVSLSVRKAHMNNAVSVASFMLGMGFSLAASYYCFLMSFSLWGFGYSYRNGPFNISRLPFVNRLWVIVICSTAFVAGLALFGGSKTFEIILVAGASK